MYPELKLFGELPGHIHAYIHVCIFKHFIFMAVLVAVLHVMLIAVLHAMLGAMLIAVLNAMLEAMLIAVLK